MVMNQSEDKVMLNKTLYVPLIMALLGLQAGFQTASGQDASEQAPKEEGAYILQSISIAKGLSVEGSGPNSAVPQACQQFEGRSAQTNYYGDYYYNCQGCYFAAPVCSTYQNDYPHRITVDIEQGARILHIKSWAPWLMYPAGPIWFACHFYVCN
jgi:hypothetical protein